VSTPYTEDYFRLVEAQSEGSAAAVVPLLCDLLRPASVVDVGCGTGTWLKRFPSHGVAEIAGIDGPWVDRSALSIPASAFEVVDLSDPPRPRRAYDLVVSLEVAEHLPPESAEPFVRFLTALGPAVAFSAAIPSQGGSGHVNEQWPEYWSELFAARGYAPFDAIRPRIWTDESVAWWFRQNLIVYVDEKRATGYEGLAGVPRRALPLVHPELFCRHVPAEPPRREPRPGPLRRAASRLRRRASARSGRAR
jgi:SAM-dependent methyltransferase